MHFKNNLGSKTIVTFKSKAKTIVFRLKIIITYESE